MAILTPCSCGVIYNLRNEFSGKYLICSECSAQLYVPCIDKAITENSLHVFDDATYFLRKNHFSISTKYSVRNSTGNEILFIERPTKYIFRIFLLIITYMLLVGSAKSMPILIPVIIVAFYCINIKRDIKIYDNKEKETLLLEIRQNDWLQKKWLRYTLYDHRGPMLGYFEKNRFSDFFRRKWYFRTPNNALILTAQEDSLIASLLRRVTGYFVDIVIFRTNFIFYAGDSEQVIGELNRQISLLNRYVLDMTMDQDKLMDCRVALALGVLLDTGEGR